MPSTIKRGTVGARVTYRGTLLTTNAALNSVQACVTDAFVQGAMVVFAVVAVGKRSGSVVCIRDFP